MSAGGAGAVSGAILVAAIVFLLQQLNYVDLTAWPTGLFLLIVPAIFGGVVFGVVGHFLGRLPGPSARSKKRRVPES